jgi:predicted RNA-binding protein (TIGR00451 family)
MALKITEFLSNKTIREFSAKTGFDFSACQRPCIADAEKTRLLMCSDKPVFFEHEGRWVETFPNAGKLPSVYVDKGALRFLVSGADVMRPGIRKTDPFQKDAAVAVRGEDNNVAVCIGIALFSSEEMMAMAKGKAIKNIHHMGDAIWNLTKA